MINQQSIHLIEKLSNDLTRAKYDLNRANYEFRVLESRLSVREKEYNQLEEQLTEQQEFNKKIVAENMELCHDIQTKSEQYNQALEFIKTLLKERSR